MSEPTDSAVRPQRTAARAVLWLLLAAALAGNVVTSLRDVDLVVHLGFGIAVLLCAAGLTVHYLRGRR